MTDRRLDDRDVGLHFLVGLRPGPDLSPEDRQLLAALRPAGVVLFGPNFDHGTSASHWTARLASLLADVRAAIGRDRVLVGIDHEGGRVHRPPPPVTHFPPALDWASRAREVGDVMGRELAGLGINLNFAPVLDILTEEANPVIGRRAMSTDPAAVGPLAMAFAAGLEGRRVLACGKHFPGHGDTRQDSHHVRPILEATLDDLRRRELVPFAHAVRNGLRVMMTSHIEFPRIDPGRPATLSRRLVTDVLRDELGFDGVVVTDDLGMRAMDGLMPDEDLGPAILAAGHDVLLLCAYWTDTSRAPAFARGIERAVAAGALDLAASRARIVALLQATLTAPDFE